MTTLIERLEATNAGSWDTWAVCPGCGDKYYAPSGSAFLANAEVCRDCGHGPVRNWPVRTFRWISFGRLMRPSTWGVGCWQKRGEPMPSYAQARAAINGETTASPEPGSDLSE